MKIKAIIASIGLTVAAAGALTVGLVRNNSGAKEVKADDPIVGSTYLSLFQSHDGENGWTDKNAKFGFYYYDDSVNPKKEGWSTSFATIVDSTNYVYSASYSLSFTPKNMIAVRFNSSASELNWGGNVWNQSSDLAFADVACIYQFSGSWAENLATVKGLAGGDVLLNSFKESTLGGNHGDSYKTGMAFTAGQTFTISHDSNTYGTTSSHLRLQEDIEDCFSVVDGKIKCLVSGTYDLYFNVSGNDSGTNPNSHTLWIQTDADNAALAFANNFLDNFTCGGTEGPNAGTVTAPEGTWDNLAIAWGKLSVASQNKFDVQPSESGTVYQQVIARYKYVIEKYGTTAYSDFMGKGFTKVGSNLINPINSNNGVAIIVVSTSVAVISLVTAYFMLKKRKESK